MASVVKRISDCNLANPPKWLPNNTAYEVIMGSMAYGVSSDTSDMDVYGFCFPKKETIFPHLSGNIQGFGIKPKGFDQWQEHGIKDRETKKEYDFSIYSILKYFKLVMDNNPNMIDSLFVPRNLIIHSSKVFEYIRENRNIFLHKGSWHKFKGYSYSSLHKLNNKYKYIFNDINEFEQKIPR